MTSKLIVTFPYVYLSSLYMKIYAATFYCTWDNGDEYVMNAQNSNYIILWLSL